LEGKTGLAELAVLVVFFQRGASHTILVPSELHSFFLRVRFHAPSRVVFLVLLGLVPTEVRNITLEVIGADRTLITIGLANRLVGPYCAVVAVKALDTVLVAVTSLIHLESHAILLAVARLALARLRTGPSWVQHLGKVSCFLAMGNLLTLLDLGSESV
jgi:hypothetical protein